MFQKTVQQVFLLKLIPMVWPIKWLGQHLKVHRIVVIMLTLMRRNHARKHLTSAIWTFIKWRLVNVIMIITITQVKQN